jgi:DNA/RNA-binding domain of Phe-tRNA-synthetase-like protein
MCQNSMLPCGMFLLVHGLNGEKFQIMVEYGRGGRNVSEGNTIGRERQGVFCRLWGWVGGLGSEVSKEVRDDWCSPTRELY